MAFAEIAKQSKSKKDLKMKSQIGTTTWSNLVQANKQDHIDFELIGGSSKKQDKTRRNHIGTNINYYNGNIISNKENYKDFECDYNGNIMASKQDHKDFGKSKRSSKKREILRRSHIGTNNGNNNNDYYIYGKSMKKKKNQKDLNLCIMMNKNGNHGNYFTIDNVSRIFGSGTSSKPINGINTNNSMILSNISQLNKNNNNNNNNGYYSNTSNNLPAWCMDNYKFRPLNDEFIDNRPSISDVINNSNIEYGLNINSNSNDNYTIRNVMSENNNNDIIFDNNNNYNINIGNTYNS